MFYNSSALTCTAGAIKAAAVFPCTAAFASPEQAALRHQPLAVLTRALGLGWFDFPEMAMGAHFRLVLLGAVAIIREWIRTAVYTHTVRNNDRHKPALSFRMILLSESTG